MNKVVINDELLRLFRKDARTLIFEGYCKNFSDVTVYCGGKGYALVANGVNGATECCIFGSTTVVDDILPELKGNVKFCGVSPEITAYLKSKYPFKWETNCDLYAWNGQPVDFAAACDLRAVDASFAQEISDGTPYKASIDEIKQSISKHPSVAAYVDGKPVCWCLLHAEGSLGMLYTVKEYRRQGYALQVMKALVNKVIAIGETPFAYIVEDNYASKNLAPKYNLQYVCKADYFEIQFNG